MLQSLAYWTYISQESLGLQGMETQSKLAQTKCTIYWLMKYKLPEWVWFRIQLGPVVQTELCLFMFLLCLAPMMWQEIHSLWQPWTHSVLCGCLSKKNIFPKNSRKILGTALVSWLGSGHVYSSGWPKWGSAQPSCMKWVPPGKRGLDSVEGWEVSGRNTTLSKVHFSDLPQTAVGESAELPFPAVVWNINSTFPGAWHIWLSGHFPPSRNVDTVFNWL